MPAHRFPMHTRSGRFRGFSLIELMIAMVIGFVVVGAVLAAYMSSSISARSGRALSQMTEDASLALNVLRTGINMVGYSTPTGIDSGTSRFRKSYMGLGLFGCDADFADHSKIIDSLSCANNGKDSIAVVYEADVVNSVVSGGFPLDCLGNPIKAATPPYLNYSQYYVQNNQLFCRGPGSNTAAALVENVVDLQLKYGVSVPTPGDSDTYRVKRYSNAAAMGTPNSADWANTLSIRVCIVVRSAEPVLNESADYQGCSGAVDVPDDDRRMYRMFTSTIVLQNRVGAVL